METRCRLAVQMLLDDREIGEVAELVGASEGSVRRWRREVEKGGMEALRAKPHPGRKPRLGEAQKQRMIQTLLDGPPYLPACASALLPPVSIVRPFFPNGPAVRSAAGS